MDKAFELGSYGLGAALAAGQAMRSSRTQTRTNRTNVASVNIPSSGAASIVRGRKRTGKSARWSNAKIKKAILGSANENIWRWQQTGNTYLGPGKMYIGWATAADPNFQIMPVHFISLTEYPQGIANNPKGCFLHGMSRLDYLQSTGNNYWNILPCETSDGTTVDGSGVWQPEYLSGTAGLANARIFHKYTDIRLNLYGTIDVPITYTVFLCTMKEQRDPFQYFAGAQFGLGTETNNMMRDWTRPLLGDILASNAKNDWKSDVRILKKHVVTLNPPQKTDGVVYEESPGAASIYNLKWFVRHDRFRDYKWSKNAAETGNDNDYRTAGWDVNLPVNLMADVEWGKRVFLVIQATSPAPDPLSSFGDPGLYYATNSTQRRSGSYDVIIRNCFREFV